MECRCSRCGEDGLDAAVGGEQRENVQQTGQRGHRVDDDQDPAVGGEGEPPVGVGADRDLAPGCIA